MSWTKAPLGQITNILSGSTPKSSNQSYWTGNNVWITPTDLGKLDSWVISKSERQITDAGVKSCNLSRIPCGSIVMSSRAPIGHLAIAGCDLYTNQGCKSFVCSDEIDPEFLFISLRHRMPEIQALGSGATFVEVSKSTLEGFEISYPQISDQRLIVARFKSRLVEIDKALNAIETQLFETANLANSIIINSLNRKIAEKYSLGEVLKEVKAGIGENWSKYPVLGATRKGLAPAKEPPGKNPQKYKPAFQETVFYNPMRILIGSIAFVDDDDEPGITSPDYVVLRGKQGILDTRWFYYWLKSSLGEQCINSLARGAVRERMLFNRLSKGEIELPSYKAQLNASKALSEIKHMLRASEQQLRDIDAISSKILAHAFEE